MSGHELQKSLFSTLSKKGKPRRIHSNRQGLRMLRVEPLEDRRLMTDELASVLCVSEPKPKGVVTPSGFRRSRGSARWLDGVQGSGTFQTQCQAASRTLHDPALTLILPLRLYYPHCLLV